VRRIPCPKSPNIRANKNGKEKIVKSPEIQIISKNKQI
jgi:hypothetical protein